MTPLLWLTAAMAGLVFLVIFLGPDPRPATRVANLAAYVAAMRLQHYAREREERFRRYHAAWSRTAPGSSTPRIAGQLRTDRYFTPQRPGGPWLN